ncbi:protein phosphatase PPM2, putative [Plasmodium malariae]|uniref:protein-serine/threonine phosphatase n=1 Tax=Plasmodium malariae TaxID=5858 RepID=A0A1A8VZB6_PLAMA|nr:protein phosphatase PPM2, putative [Plasmodium malariae]
MGAYLSAPKTNKESIDGGNLELDPSRYGLSCMQGWRKNMEDSHICYNNLKVNEIEEDISIYGVFDGHGGPNVSKWISYNFRRIFIKCIKEASEELIKKNIDKSKNYKLKLIKLTLEKTFLKLDEEMLLAENQEKLKKYSVPTQENEEESDTRENYLYSILNDIISKNISIKAIERDGKRCLQVVYNKDGNPVEEGSTESSRSLTVDEENNKSSTIFDSSDGILKYEDDEDEEFETEINAKDESSKDIEDFDDDDNINNNNVFKKDGANSNALTASNNDTKVVKGKKDAEKNEYDTEKKINGDTEENREINISPNKGMAEKDARNDNGLLNLNKENKNKIKDEDNKEISDYLDSNDSAETNAKRLKKDMNNEYSINEKDNNNNNSSNSNNNNSSNSNSNSNNNNSSSNNNNNNYNNDKNNDNNNYDNNNYDNNNNNKEEENLINNKEYNKTEKVKSELTYDNLKCMEQEAAEAKNKLNEDCDTNNSTNGNISGYDENSLRLYEKGSSSSSSEEGFSYDEAITNVIDNNISSSNSDANNEGEDCNGIYASDELRLFENYYSNDYEDNIAYSCGSTAIVAVILKGYLIVANAGDSRAIVCFNGNSLGMSTDHKPHLQEEETRIKKAGGYISNGRVDGNLNLTRAIGDLHYKRDPFLPQKDQKISAFPEVTCVTLTPDDEFLFLACDGIWDCKDGQDVVGFVKTRLEKFEEPTNEETHMEKIGNHEKNITSATSDNIVSSVKNDEENKWKDIENNLDKEENRNVASNDLNSNKNDNVVNDVDIVLATDENKMDDDNNNILQEKNENDEMHIERDDEDETKFDSAPIIERTKFEKFNKLSQICEELCDECLSNNYKENDGIGCDNMTCLIVQYNPVYKIHTEKKFLNIDEIE